MRYLISVMMLIGNLPATVVVLSDKTWQTVDQTQLINEVKLVVPV